MESSLVQSMLIAGMVGLASGSIGAFIIVKRMALVGDAFSHVALPGIAVALAYRFDPWWGVVVFLLGAAWLTWWFEGKTALPTEALVGLLFVASLAVGIFMIPESEIIESLFGEFPSMPLSTLMFFLLAAALLALLSYYGTRKFLFSIVSQDLAAVSGIGGKLRLFFLIIFALVVSLGIKLVGVLLMGALTIIPALIAKNIAGTMKSYMIWSSVLGALISFLGVAIAHLYGFLPGPTIILLGVMFFLISLPFAKATHSNPPLSRLP